MALEKIPVLNSGYPLFDWSKYQSSRDALVANGLVSNFKKEAWNEITDILYLALEAAGYQWDSLYTSYNGSKITEAYGELSAKKFNSVSYNIDKLASVGWEWEIVKDSRGYLGRREMRGFEEYGKNCDFVYPEYIIELVRRLNLLIEIMRGTANTSKIESFVGGITSIFTNFEAIPTAPMEYIGGVFTSQEANIIPIPTAKLRTEDIISKTRIDRIFVLLRQTAPVLFEKISKSTDKAKVNAVPTKVIKAYNELSKSKSKSIGEMKKIRSYDLREVGIISNSGYKSDMDVYRSLQFEFTEAKSWSNSLVGLNSALSSPMPEIGKISRTNYLSEFLPVEPKLATAYRKSKSYKKVNLSSLESRAIEFGEVSKTKQYCVVDKLIVSGISGATKSKTVANVKIDSLWYPPIWEEDVLWIRQTWNNKQEGEVLHIDAVSDFVVKEKSESVILAKFDTAWYPPELINGVLFVRQAYETAQTENELEVI